MRQQILNLAMIHGVIFDLDGTLVDSRLDFDLMREEMGLPAGQPILESLAALSAERRHDCETILHRHEVDGAARAVPLPGVPEFLAELDLRGLQRAVMTRNSRVIAQQMLTRLPGRFDPVITRDDGPVKPDPWGVHAICDAWRASPDQVLVLGDSWFDIACGRAAGALTSLYSGGVEAPQLVNDAGADFVLPCFTRSLDFWNWLGS